MVTSLADVEGVPQPRTRARAETGLVRSRRRMMNAHEELELAIGILREVAGRGEVEQDALAERIPVLDEALRSLEVAQRILDEGVHAATSGRSGR
jgi:hypothetical protein